MVMAMEIIGVILTGMPQEVQRPREYSSMELHCQIIVLEIVGTSIANGFWWLCGRQ